MMIECETWIPIELTLCYVRIRKRIFYFISLLFLCIVCHYWNGHTNKCAPIHCVCVCVCVSEWQRRLASACFETMRREWTRPSHTCLFSTCSNRFSYTKLFWGFGSVFWPFFCLIFFLWPFSWMKFLIFSLFLFILHEKYQFPFFIFHFNLIFFNSIWALSTHQHTTDITSAIYWKRMKCGKRRFQIEIELQHFLPAYLVSKWCYLCAESECLT